jgi:hypothetical protein
MSRLASLAFLVVAVPSLAPVVGCQKSHAESSAQPSAIGGGPGPKVSATPTSTLLPGATCVFPERLDKDVTIKAGCVVDVMRNALVESGTTLTIEPGVTMRFQEATYLEVGHKGSRLVAKGTADKPIVFTSGLATKRPGDWVGIVFDDAVGLQGSIISHAIVEYGGRASHGGEGAITVFTPFPAGRVSIEDTIFRRNNLTAIADRFPASTFGSFARNRFENNAHALRVSAAVLASLGDGNTFYDEIEVLGGTVQKVGAWPKTEHGILVSAPVAVEGDDAKLTLAPGTTVKLAPGTWLEIGVKARGALDAENCTFTSAAADPKPGDWVGIFFGEHTTHSRISGGVIEYAGMEEHGGDGAITFVGKRSWQALDVGIFGVQFKSLKQAHISDNGEGCNKALDPRNGIAFTGGVEPCR